ncbi:serine/threonine-protein kinase Pkh2p [Monosporozyma unispora]|nr:hypothetical protein C6P44_002745 [Kazachstania unispora]
MHYEAPDDDYHPRPLLPTDEEALTSQIAKKILSKKSNTQQLPKSTRFHISPFAENEYDGSNKDLSMNQRSASNRNMSDLLMISRNKPSMQKALTDTNNFIEIFNRDNKNDNSNNDETQDEEGIDDEDYDNENNDNISLDSMDNTIPAYTPLPQPIIDIIPEVLNENGKVEDKTKEPHEESMTLHTTLKKRRDDWADRGAAKVTKEVINPHTGEKTKKVIKKGIKDFKFGDEIGDGAYSTVMLATAIDSGKKYAVKVLNKEYLIKQKKVKYVNIEKNALQRVNNSNSIIKLYFTFQDETSLYFLLEYAPNGDFLSLLKKYGSLNEDVVRYYSAQIIDAIGYLHSKGIIHRDMKPENILLDSEWKVKLTDFGTAKILERSPTSKRYDLLTRSKSFVGTAEYVSPELLNDSYVDFRCDIWAFGCIVFQMIAGKPPFKATNEYLTFQKVMKVQYAFTPGFPTVIRDLVKRILLKPIDQRLTIPQIERHHFYKSINFKDGSVWSNPVPELSAYKVTAKSMQPIPALKGPMIYKRPQISTNIRKTSSSIPSTPTSREPSQSRITSASNLVLTSTAGHHVSASSSPHTPSTPVHSSPSPIGINTDRIVRKAPDERTTAILESAKRSVETKKQMLNKRITSNSHIGVPSAKRNPDGADSSGSTNNTPHPSTAPSPIPNSSNRKHSNSGPTSSSSTSSALPEKATSKSDLDLPSHNPPLPPRASHSAHPSRPSSRSSSRSKGSVPASPALTSKTSNLSENIQAQTIKEQTIPHPPSSSAIAAEVPVPVSLNKQDIQWSFYLKSIQEHVLQVQEMYITVVDTDLIDRKLSRYNKRLTEPLEFNHGRSTLLSQVARSGGDVTGFRYSDSHAPEEDYYASSYIDESALIEDYRYHFEFLHLLMSDENSESSPSESPLSPVISSDLGTTDESNSAFSGKVKKFWQQAKNGGLLDANTLHERFQKRTIVITSFGRLLVFARYIPQAKRTSNNFELVYDINLCQISVEIKEILMTTPQNNLAAVVTPYKSFILCNTINTLTSNNISNSSNIDNWFKVIKKSISLATDQNKPTHGKISPPQSLSKEQIEVAKIAAMKSPKLPPNKPKTPKLTSPRVVNKERKFASPPMSDGKHTFSESIKASGTNRGSRMFSTYVSAKEKQHKKHSTQPIPSSSKLVSGLPSTSASVLLGLGLNSNSHSGKTSNHSSPSPSLSSNSKPSHSKFGFKH